MLQILAAILFFYVFGLAAIALTAYIWSICSRFFREKQQDTKKE